jgi:hypothetical protein
MGEMEAMAGMAGTAEMGAMAGMAEMEAIAGMAGTAWMARGSGGQGWVTSEKFPEIIPLQKCNN